MAEPTAPYPKYLDWLRYLSACLLFTYGLSKLLGIQFTLPPEMALRPVGSLTGRALAYVVLLQLFACSCEHSRTDATCKRLSFLCHCDVRPKVPVELIRGLLAMTKTGQCKRRQDSRRESTLSCGSRETERPLAARGDAVSAAQANAAKAQLSAA